MHFNILILQMTFCSHENGISQTSLFIANRMSHERSLLQFLLEEFVHRKRNRLSRGNTHYTGRDTFVKRLGPFLLEHVLCYRRDSLHGRLSVCSWSLLQTRFYFAPAVSNVFHSLQGNKGYAGCMFWRICLNSVYAVKLTVLLSAHDPLNLLMGGHTGLI